MLGQVISVVEEHMRKLKENARYENQRQQRILSIDPSGC